MRYSEKRPSNYKAYITGLKGLASVMVMLGHFLGVFVYSESLPEDMDGFLAFSRSRIGFIIDEEFWLYLFFVISGYLLAYSKIEKLRDLFARYIQRFLRLGLPILFAYAIIFIIYKTVGFHNGETIAGFENSWYQESFSDEYSIWDVLLSPVDILILGKESLNPPYWVLRNMFIASHVIYTSIYLTNVSAIKKRRVGRLIPLLALVVTFAVSIIIDDQFIVSCVAGYVLYWCEKNIESWKTTAYFYAAILCVMLLIRALDRHYYDLLLFAALIVYIPKLKLLLRAFSSKTAVFTGNISFGIYSFHWPIYCSVGALLIMYFHTRVGLAGSVMLAMIISCVLTFAVSWLYHISFERLSGFITGKVFGLLRRKQ